MESEATMFLDSFTYPDNSQASDTVSVDSSDSLETSFSACSPDNISRCVLLIKGLGENSFVWSTWRLFPLFTAEPFHQCLCDAGDV